MKARSGMKLGVLLLLIAGLLFFAGCTQPASVPAGTPSPTLTTIIPTTAHPVATPSVPPLNGTTVGTNVTDLKEHLAAQAGIFAGEINRTALAAAYTQGPNSTAYQVVLDQLREFKTSDPRIIYLYTLELKNGKVYFIVDADYGMPNGSGFMDEYTDAPGELFSPVRSPIAVGPYTDHWGTFYSGYAPVDIGSNRTLLIGVDVRA